MLKVYYSIVDYSDVNHLPEKEFYRKLDQIKRQQHEIMNYKKKDSRPKTPKTSKSCSRQSDHQLDYPVGHNFEAKRNITEHISFADDGNSVCSWQMEFGSITCRKRENKLHSRLSSAASRPRTSHAGESRCKKHSQSCISSGNGNPQSRLSHVRDDYEMLNNLKSCRSKSISPTRSQINEIKLAKAQEDENKFYSDMTNDKLLSDEHLMKKSNPIPITSRIPMYDQVVADQEHKNQLAKLESAIKLQSQMKPFHFSESRNSTRKCLSRSFSSPHLKQSDNDSEPEDTSINNVQFKANPFPKNLFCNYVHYRMWEDNYFRALNKKLRAEELLKLSKLPPSMAKREEVLKLKENYEECLRASSAINKHVDIIPQKKKKLRKKNRKVKCSTNPIKLKRSDYSQCSRSYSDFTSTTTTTKHRDTPTSDNKFLPVTPSPLYPVNRPNLAATLRFERTREKLKQSKQENDMIMSDKFRRPHWGVKQSHAFQQLNYETSNEDEIAIRLATRRAEQKQRQEEHDVNMEMMKQRVKTAPLLLEGPSHLAPRLGHIYHHCDNAIDKKKVNTLSSSNINLNKHHSKSVRPASTISTNSKRTESSINSKCT
ncbi:unnamed protein product [Diamesa serratosioi]